MIRAAAWQWGDSENDLELFAATGHGVLVGSIASLKLQEAAWQQIDSLGQLSLLTAY